VDDWFAQSALRADPALGPQDWVPLGDPEAIRESLIQRQSREYELMLGPDPDAVKFPSLLTVAKRVRSVREGLLRRWASARPLKKPLSEVVSRWEELRRPLNLWVPEFVPDNLESTPCPMRYNAYLMETRNTPFLSTWRRFAIAAVSREDPPWLDQVLPRGVFP
jgi:hypothetical protein